MRTSVEPAPSSVAAAGPQGHPQLLWFFLALLVLPMLVSAGLLLFDIGSSYLPTADRALIEMKVRDVGREPVLTGLYSRSDWSHPGPAQFYLLAPFYWLTGSASVGLHLGALVVNSASLVGMALIARRRGGTPLLLITLLAGSLLVRTLGADFVRDPWNCFMTVLPFGLLVFLVWSLTAGDAWALPVAVGVASYVAQAHVGYLVLAVPLLGFGVLWLGIGVVRTGSKDQRTLLTRASLAAAGVGAVLWLPTLVEALRSGPSNAGEIMRYFRTTEEEAHTFVDGWNVLSAQFSTFPEWLTWHRAPNLYSGEPPSLDVPPLPWLFVVVAVAGAVLWKRSTRGGVQLVVTWTVVVGLGVLAIARTVGLVFDYRLRWTWISGMVAFVVIAWAGWTLISSKWDRAGRVLGPLTGVALVVLAGLNVLSAVRADVPYEADSEVLAALMPDVLRAVEDTKGEVLVTDSLAGSWYARGVVLALERHGFEARVTADRRELFGDSRVVSDSRPAARLHIGVGGELDSLAEDPRFRPLSVWRSVSPAEIAEMNGMIAELDADLAAGRIDTADHLDATVRLKNAVLNRSGAFAYAVAIYLDIAPAD